MSEYHKQTTNYKDSECLVQSLNEMGYATVEVHEDAQQLYDFQGRPTHYLEKDGDKANIIVRRHIVGGAANDLGFKLNPETGTYDAIISQYDNHKHNASWLTQLKKNYAEKVAIKTASRQGFKYLGKKVVGKKVQLQWLDTRSN